MSAYIVSTDTIDLLISAADAWRVTFRSPADQSFLHACSYRRDEAGQLLLDENVRSVNARYRETEAAGVYRFQPVDLDRAARGLSIPILVLGLVRCLRYQSCEADDYGTTRAAEFLDRIEAEAIRKLTIDAPWGWTRETAAAVAD